MIHPHITPRIRYVTVVAGVTTLDMCCWLTLGSSAVVARATGAEHGIVVNSCDVLEGRGCVAIFAHIRGVDVSGIFARSVHAIVTRRAVACYRTVIELGIAPRVCVVAVITGVSTSNVGC